LTFRGFSSLDLIEETIKDLKAAVAQLKPGFDVITDISDYKTAKPEIAQAIQRMQVYLKESGMRRVVRIVSDQNVITKMQFKRTSDSAGYAAEMATSVEEADALLDG
jgi:hypothetical protein